MTEIVIDGCPPEHPLHDGLVGMAGFLNGLYENESDRPDRLTVLTYFDRLGVPRIAEIDSVWEREGGGMAGASWMRSDVGASGVIFRAENLASVWGIKPEIMFSDGSGARGDEPTIYDERAEAMWALDYEIRGERAEDWHACLNCESKMETRDEGYRCSDVTCPFHDLPQGVSTDDPLTWERAR